MTIKIFADGAVLPLIRDLARDERISGFTTNPSLARKEGVTDYRAFGREVLESAGGRPVSIEVLADDFGEMERQAHEIASWGANAVVKVPVTDTRGTSSAGLIERLTRDGVPLNVTAVFTVDQVREIGVALAAGTGPAIVSVFAGRIADAGVDPEGHVRLCRRWLRWACPRAEMLWASPRQVYDVALAGLAGCEIITMTPDLIAKLMLVGKDLAEYSRETVETFYRDAVAAGYEL